MRLPVQSEDWGADLPPVADDWLATVVFNHFSDLASQSVACVMQGYVVAGVHEIKQSWNFADVVVERAFIANHHDWYEAIQNRDAKLYDLAMGPVAMLLKESIKQHAAIWESRDMYENIV